MIPKALVLGGGADQLPGVIELSTLSYFTIVVDQNNNCVSKKYCSLFLNISSKNCNKIHSELTRLGLDQQITYILVIGTDLPHIAAELALQLKCKYFSNLAAAKLSIDKYEFKKQCLANSISVPKCVYYGKHDFPFPVIIKPNKSSGSKGVFICNDEAEILEKVHFLKKNNPTVQILVEEHIEGEQISSEHIIYNNKVYTFGCAWRNYKDFHNQRPHIIENGGIQPSEWALSYIDQIENIALKCSKLFGIDHGIIKLDLIVCKDVVYCLEAALRFSGGHFCSDIIPRSLNFNFINYGIKACLKDPSIEKELFNASLKKNSKVKKVVANRYFIAKKSGIVKAVIVHKDVKKIVDQIEINVKPGDQVEKAASNAQRMGYFIISSHNIRELNRKVLNVYSKVRILID